MLTLHVSLNRASILSANGRDLGRTVARTWRIEDDAPDLVYGGITLHEIAEKPLIPWTEAEVAA